MARKSKPQAHENHERWLVSYADFITLLFAFFVVMFATSQADKGKAKQVSESVKKALQESHMRQMVAAVLGGTVDQVGQGNAQMRGPGGSRKETPKTEAPADVDGYAGVVKELVPTLTALSGVLQSEIASGAIQVSLEKRGLVISFKQAALFPSGGDEIGATAEASIAKVADGLRQLPNLVRLEGHTDSRPINNARFRSNWELSAARSIALMELLVQKHGISRSRLSIGGYADIAPVDSNGTEAGRARNRRVDLVILSETGMASEPKR